MLYSGNSGCNRTKWLYSGKNDCVRTRWLYLANVVVVRRDGISLAKRLCSGKVVVFWQNCCIEEKTVVFEQIGYLRAKWFFSGKKWL